MSGPISAFRSFLTSRSDARRRAHFEASVTHAGGPEAPTVPDGAPICLAVLGAAEAHLPAFLAHYRGLGVAHFAFLLAEGHEAPPGAPLGDDVTLISTPLLLAQNLDLMRATLLRRFGAQRWCLMVEVDELLTFEGAGEAGLPELIAYLEHEGATALIAQSLEMFPKTPPEDWPQWDLAQAVEAFLYYDPTDIALHAYDGYHALSQLNRQNALVGAGHQIAFGGIWARLFGEERCLTRHPLFFQSGEVAHTHPLVPTRLTCSEVTGILKSYRLMNPAFALSADQPLFTLEARRWSRPEVLAKSGLIQSAPAFRAFLQDLAS